MQPGSRRSHWEITREILQKILTMEVGGTARLRHCVGTNNAQFWRYLTFLEQRNLITLERRANRIKAFQVTARGQQVLELLDRLFELLESNADCET